LIEVRIGDDVGLKPILLDKYIAKQFIQKEREMEVKDSQIRFASNVPSSS